MRQLMLLLVLLAGCGGVISPNATNAALEQARSAAAAIIPLTLATMPPAPTPTPPGPDPIPPMPDKRDAEIAELKRELAAESAQVERVQTEWQADRERMEAILKRLEKLELQEAFPVAPPTPKVVTATVMPPPQVGSVQWNNSWQTAKDEATSTGKPVLLWFTMEGCQWCERVEQQCFGDPEVADYINANTVPLKVHKEKQSSDILRKWQVDSYPAFRAIRSDWSGWRIVDNTMQPSEWLSNLDELVSWNIKPQSRRIVSSPYYEPYYDAMPVYVEQGYYGDDMTCGPGGCGPSMSYPSMSYGSRWGGGYSGGGFFGGGGGCASCQ